MKRLFAFLLALVMAVSILPIATVHATELEEIPAEVTVPEETEAPADEELPEETTAPEEVITPVEEELPEETTAPEEELPVEETATTTMEPAAEQNELELTANRMTVAPDPGLPDNSELFEAYAEQLFYGNEVATFGITAGSRLRGDEKVLYDILATYIKQIAAGKRSSTVITIGETVNYDGTTYTPEVRAKFTNSNISDQNMDNVINALLADFPYELYWYDKVTGTQAYYISGSVVLYVEIYMFVADNYSTGSYFATDTTITSAATKAAANAKSIVSNYKSKSDYGKLLAYKDKICDLVEYDFDAIYYGDFSIDNDPWQLIHVFDGDSNTNVVCEGYSKAYKYLCDLTSFSGDVDCYTVTGGMDGGAHMWNIVTLGGNNYLVDVTNSDYGTVGDDGSLFLAGGYGSPTSGYTIGYIDFTYDAETQNVWGTGSNSILKLANNYCSQPPAAPTVTVTNVASTGKPKISWNEVDGATKYKVYRSTDGGKTYKLLSTVSSTSLTNSSTTVGDKYYYYVVAIDANSLASDKSNVVSRVCDLPRPTVKIAVVASTGKLKLTWDKIDGAKSYSVYRSTDGGETYSLLSTVSGTSLTNSSTTAGNMYYYKVKANHTNSSATSAYSSVVKGTCDLPRPTVKIAVVASTGKLKLTWDKIDGAKNYSVYRSTDGGETYSLLSTTTGTSLTNSSATAGNMYYYKVKANHTNSSANSAYSSVVKGTCDLPRPTVKIAVVSSTGKLKLTWDKIDGAKSYSVYRSTDGGETYSLLSTVSGTSLTNSSATAGNVYYYKVKANHTNSSANSAYSSVVKGTCDLPRPTASVALNSSGKPVITWEKVSGATKYTVYIYDADGNLLKTTSTTNTKLTHSSAVKDTTYSYQVVAVHSNSAANSAKSTAVSIKCTK